MEQVQAQPVKTFSSKISEFLEKYPIILQLCRFGGIGIFNTALDALILNFLSAKFGVTKGLGLGWVNLPGFVLAVIQSYYWNRYWTFESQSVTLIKNFFRLVAVGLAGFLIFGLMLLGAHQGAGYLYFAGIFGLFVIVQLILWHTFGFFHSEIQAETPKYLQFFLVSLGGFLISSATLYTLTTHFVLSANSGDNLNFAKILATILSLVWNFIGYKIFVFKK